MSLHEQHRIHRTGWLRAAVLGANDGQFLNVDVGSRGGALDYKIENPDGFVPALREQP